jgi:RNA polymerase sigma factor (sigma-70 family)
MQETQEISDFGKAALTQIDSLWRTALWFTNNEHEAETLIISTYVEASSCWEGLFFKPESKTWMFKILIKKLATKKTPNFRAQFPDYFENINESLSSDYITKLKIIPADMMNSAIRRLPVENRLVIVLSIYEKFTYSEIAGILGIHRTNVSLKIHQGYVLIQKELIMQIAASDISLLA